MSINISSHNSKDNQRKLNIIKSIGSSHGHPSLEVLDQDNDLKEDSIETEDRDYNSIGTVKYESPKKLLQDHTENSQMSLMAIQPLANGKQRTELYSSKKSAVSFGCQAEI